MDNRGGKRPGSGRRRFPPAMRPVSVNIRLPAWLAAWLRAAPGSQAKTIQQALVDQHDLKAPDDKQQIGEK